MGKNKTHEEFMKEFYEKNPNSKYIDILNEYKNVKTKIKCKCKIDGYEWEVRPDSLLNGSGCQKCYNKRRGNSLKSTHEKFIEKFYVKNKNFKNIEILGEYNGNKKPIKCKCKIDNHIWYPTPTHLLEGQSCPKCAGNIKKTTEEFINELNKVNKDIEILSDYNGANKPIDCKCKIDGHKWSPTPHSLLEGYGCPKCAIINNIGENNPRWNPNLTQEDREDKRNYQEYREWRIRCFERDNYTCQVTGKRGVELCVHHLYSYDKYRCLRTVDNNGITVSKEIHELFHKKYGKGNNTLEQWEEFIKSLK